MSKLINEMETHEIITYLRRERYIHGLFYVDREEVIRNFGIEISDKDWLALGQYSNFSDKC